MAKFSKRDKTFVPEPETNNEQMDETNQPNCDANMSDEESCSDNLSDNPIEALTNELEALKDAHLRLIADFDNYRKRTLKEKSELIKSGGESVFVNILPVIDDFERALKHIDDSSDIESLKEGVNLIYEKFISFLNKNGVKAIESNGADFNTDLFEAVAIVPMPDLKGKVMDTIEKGYLLNDKVIRHAKVVVGE